MEKYKKEASMTHFKTLSVELCAHGLSVLTTVRVRHTTPVLAPIAVHYARIGCDKTLPSTVYALQIKPKELRHVLNAIIMF